MVNFGSQKKLFDYHKKAYFMTSDIDLAGEKQAFLTNTSFLNKGKVKFLKARHYERKMLPKT